MDSWQPSNGTYREEDNQSINLLTVYIGILMWFQDWPANTSNIPMAGRYKPQEGVDYWELLNARIVPKKLQLRSYYCSFRMSQPSKETSGESKGVIGHSSVRKEEIFYLLTI